MWQIGLLVLAVALEVSGDVKTGVNPELVQRLKRSPGYYDCGPPGPPPPPPPPPPYWPPPPPPPPYWSHQHPPPPWGQPGQQYQAYSQATAESNAVAANSNSYNGGNIPNNNQGGNNQGGNNVPCTTCGNGSNAVSNANSETGEAVAVAIARATAH